MRKTFNFFGIGTIVLVSSLALAGCPSPANGTRLDPVVTSVEVVLALPDPGVVFEGEEGTIHYRITVVGDGVFPVNFPGPYVEITMANGNALLPGITVNWYTITGPGVAFPLSFTVDGLNAGTYPLRVSVHGEYAYFTLSVDSISPVVSVNVVPDPVNPGTAVSGFTATLNYLITIGVALVPGIFPVDIPGPYVDVTLASGDALPPGITVNRSTVGTPGMATPLSFSVNRPEGAVYSLIVRVHGRVSAPFDLVVVPGLTGTVTLDGTAQVGQELTANVADLGGTGTLSFLWEVGTYPDFEGILGVTGENYVVRAGDLNRTVRVIVTSEGYYGYAIGGPTVSITSPDHELLGGTVAVQYYIPQVGQVLTADTEALGAGGAIAFQWQRGAGSGFIPIFGATGSTYVLSSDDVGWTVRVVVTREGRSGYVASEPTATVERKPLVAEQIAALHMETPLPATAIVTTAIAAEEIALQSLTFGGTITITLRSGTPGDVLYLGRPGTMFTVGNGVTLILEDVTLRGMDTPNTNALVVVGNRGTLEMRAGSVIEGNNNTSLLMASQGGGVRVNAGGRFVMVDGEISGNDAPMGSGVLVGGTVTNPSTFTMRGGAIFDNFATQGGGVAIESGGTFAMEGGEIAFNFAQIGGGVFNAGTFTMQNDVEIFENFSLSAGGGVFNAGAFTMGSGALVRNITFSQGGAGGGVFNEGAFNLEGGEISGNFAENPAGGQGNGGGVANWDGGTFTMRGGEIFDNGAQTFGGGVINVGSGAFNMYAGEILRNMALSHGGGVNNNAGGTFTMRGGEITGNIAAFGGGVSSLNLFTMHNGEISGNDAHQGGGVRVNTGTFTMHGGRILDNHALLGITGTGASLNMGGGVSNLGTFNMHGGAIGERRIETINGEDVVVGRNISVLGGGVENRGFFNIHGGAINGNVAASAGGGVENFGVFNMRGNVEISGNEAQWGGGVENLGTFNMEGGRIFGNTARHNDGGGGVENLGGIFRISNGTIYGDGAEAGLGNVAPRFAVLVNADLVIDGETFEYVAQHGTFNGVFTSLGNLPSSTAHTIEVEGGALIRPVATEAGLLSFAATGNMKRFGWMSPEGLALPRVLTEGPALPQTRTLPEGFTPSAEQFTFSVEKLTLTERLDVPSLRRAFEQNKQQRMFMPLPRR